MKVLKFSASWCLPCRVLEKSLNRLGITDYESIDIDTDEGSELVNKYRVRSVPTLVKIDEEGITLDFQSGSKSDKEIKEFFEV